MVKFHQSEEFLVSFVVDASGGHLQSKRFPQLRIIVPPNATSSPTRIVCHFLKPDRSNLLPELNDCNGFVSRILQLHSSCIRFEKPIIIEVPHIASLRNKEREIMILRKNPDAKVWKEHITQDRIVSLKDIFGELFESITTDQDLLSQRITRIVTDDIPNYFCLVSRFYRDSCLIGPEGGSIRSEIDNRIKIRFPPNALIKKIQISLEVQTIDPGVLKHVLGDNNQVHMSPIVTVEPKRRRFRDQIELHLPLPEGLDVDNVSNLRILCSLSEFETKWNDITDSVELLLQDDYIIHSTKISARFWLIWAPALDDVSELANEVYGRNCCTPYIGRFFAFTRRQDVEEWKLRLILSTDGRNMKTLESLENYQLIEMGAEVEILDDHEYKVEVAGNLVSVTNSDEPLRFRLSPFNDNRLTVPLRIRNHEEPFTGKVAFIPDFKLKVKQVIRPITTLDINLPVDIVDDKASPMEPSQEVPTQIEELIPSKADDSQHQMNLRKVAKEVDCHWPQLALELGLELNDLDASFCESCRDYDKALITLVKWQQNDFDHATVNELNRALHSIGRNEVLNKCRENESDKSDNEDDESMEHDHSWYSFLKPIKDLERFKDSIDDSTLALLGDDWSERAKDDNKEMSDYSENKSLVEVDTPNNETADDWQANVAMDVIPDSVDDSCKRDQKTNALLWLASEMDKATPEPILYNIDATQEEAPERVVILRPSYSGMPSHMDYYVEEEEIIPVNVSRGYGNLGLGMVKEAKNNCEKPCGGDRKTSLDPVTHIPNKDAVLAFISEFDKVIPEPRLHDDYGYKESDEPRETFIHEKLSMTGHTRFEEELIIPVNVTKTFGNVSINNENEDSQRRDDTANDWSEQSPPQVSRQSTDISRSEENLQIESGETESTSFEDRNEGPLTVSTRHIEDYTARVDDYNAVPIDIIEESAQSNNEVCMNNTGNMPVDSKIDDVTFDWPLQLDLAQYNPEVSNDNDNCIPKQNEDHIESLYFVPSSTEIKLGEPQEEGSSTAITCSVENKNDRDDSNPDWSKQSTDINPIKCHLESESGETESCEHQDDGPSKAYTGTFEVTHNLVDDCIAVPIDFIEDSMYPNNEDSKDKTDDMPKDSKIDDVIDDVIIDRPSKVDQPQYNLGVIADNDKCLSNDSIKENIQQIPSLTQEQSMSNKEIEEGLSTTFPNSFEANTEGVDDCIAESNDVIENSPQTYSNVGDNHANYSSKDTPKDDAVVDWSQQLASLNTEHINENKETEDHLESEKVEPPFLMSNETQISETKEEDPKPEDNTTGDGQHITEIPKKPKSRKNRKGKAKSNQM